MERTSHWLVVYNTCTIMKYFLCTWHYLEFFFGLTLLSKQLPLWFPEKLCNFFWVVLCFVLNIHHTYCNYTADNRLKSILLKYDSTLKNKITLMLESMWYPCHCCIICLVHVLLTNSSLLLGSHRQNSSKGMLVVSHQAEILWTAQEVIY